LYQREQEAGITIHRIEKRIDTGDILMQQYVSIEKNETLDNLIKKTKRKDAYMIADIIKNYRTEKVVGRKMSGESSYFTFPKRSDVKKFIKMGNRII
jgi:methionyl-tRNA formyltransferase